jgi:hypothetical protein
MDDAEPVEEAESRGAPDSARVVGPASSSAVDGPPPAIDGGSVSARRQETTVQAVQELPRRRLDPTDADAARSELERDLGPYDHPEKPPEKKYDIPIPRYASFHSRPTKSTTGRSPAS